MVVRGARATRDTNDAIVTLSKIGQNNRRNDWHSIENGGSNRKMKYNHTRARRERERHYKSQNVNNF